MDKAKIPCFCIRRGPEFSHWVSKGRYWRKSDGRWISRWECTLCRISFSQSTLDACYRQKKRRLNIHIYRLFSSGVSQRRIAKLLHIHRTTVIRKIRFLAMQARQRHQMFLKSFNVPLTEVQFDDMETFEHSKLKPLSITMAVTKERKILGAVVSQMPAKGLLAKRSVDKYGPRRDRRSVALKALLRTLRPITDSHAVFRSDQNPHYPFALKRCFPNAVHITTKGLRGCVVGQGELKATAWDPIFSLNHTAAMLRANMNRLFRQTWCTTKTRQGLKDHLAIFIDYFNSQLVAAR